MSVSYAGTGSEVIDPDQPVIFLVISALRCTENEVIQCLSCPSLKLCLLDSVTRVRSLVRQSVRSLGHLGLVLVSNLGLLRHVQAFGNAADRQCIEASSTANSLRVCQEPGLCSSSQPDQVGLGQTPMLLSWPSTDMLLWQCQQMCPCTPRPAFTPFAFDDTSCLGCQLSSIWVQQPAGMHSASAAY